MNSPFDKAKYETLLKGHEIQEVSLSKLERTFRIDAEFYSYHSIKLIEKLLAIKSRPLTCCGMVGDGNHMAIRDSFTKGEIPYYRGGDIYSYFIEDAAPSLTIPEAIYNSQSMQRAHIKAGDVLVSIIGAIIGNIAIVKGLNKAACSCKLAIIRPKQINDAAFISSFLRSRFGQGQLQRLRRGSSQTGVLLEDFDQILVPICFPKLKVALTTLIDKAYKVDQDCIGSYRSAKTIFLDYLGVSKWKPSSINHKTDLWSKVQQAGRIDAEFFQPKYDALFSRLANFSCSALGDVVSIAKSIEPGSDAYLEEGIPFIRIADVSPFGIETPSIFLSKKTPGIELLFPKKDTILLSKDGSCCIAYKIENDLRGVTSGALLHLTVKNPDFLPDYVTLVLNSMIGRMQAERDAGGSIISHWKPDEIRKVVIPKLPMEQQQAIVAKVRESFAKRAESKRLLDCAKRTVEIAIESGEPAAMQYLAVQVPEVK